jgi:hypothetical protein
MNTEDFIILTLAAATSAMKIIEEPGVADLPTGCKSKFALAVSNERKGNFEKAYKYLDEAVALEAEFLAANAPA